MGSLFWENEHTDGTIVTTRILKMHIQKVYCLLTQWFAEVECFSNYGIYCKIMVNISSVIVNTSEVGQMDQ